MKGHIFARALRTDFKHPFTSVGSYPLFLLMTDGGSLCWKCAHAERAQIRLAAMRVDIRSGWAPVGVDVNWEDPALHCDNCGERIESAYAEDEVPNVG